MWNLTDLTFWKNTVLFVSNNLIWFTKSAMTADTMFPHNWSKKNRAMEREVMDFVQPYRIYLHGRCQHLWLFICLLSDVLLFLSLRPLFVRKHQVPTNRKKIIGMPNRIH